MNYNPTQHQRDQKREFHSRPLTAKLSDFPLRSNREERELEQQNKEQPKQQDIIIIRGHSDESGMSLILPLRFSGMRCYPLIDYKKMEIHFDMNPDNGNKEMGVLVTKNQPDAKNCYVKYGAKWSNTNFNIPQQGVPLVDGKSFTVKFLPSEPTEKKARRSSPQPAPMNSPFVAVDTSAQDKAKETAKQCIKYLNAYVNQNPDVFKFHIVDNNIKVTVQDTLE